MKKNTNNPELMNGYLAEMKKANCCDMDYYRKYAGVIVTLTNGGYFVVGKSRVETSFCFGYDTDYSGHELNDAENARRAFLASADAFKRENMRDLDRNIHQLTEGKDSFWGCDVYPVLQRVSYYGQSEELNVWQINWMRAYEMVEKGLQPINDADRAIILGAYQTEKENFNKRLDTYLKRYGTSKLHTWTYWRD